MTSSKKLIVSLVGFVLLSLSGSIYAAEQRFTIQSASAGDPGTGVGWTFFLTNKTQNTAVSFSNGFYKVSLTGASGALQFNAVCQPQGVVLFNTWQIPLSIQQGNVSTPVQTYALHLGFDTKCSRLTHVTVTGDPEDGYTLIVE